MERLFRFYFYFCISMPIIVFFFYIERTDRMSCAANLNQETLCLLHYSVILRWLELHLSRTKLLCWFESIFPIIIVKLCGYGINCTAARIFGSAQFCFLIALIGFANYAFHIFAYVTRDLNYGNKVNAFFAFFPFNLLLPCCLPSDLMCFHNFLRHKTA